MFTIRDDSFPANCWKSSGFGNRGDTEIVAVGIEIMIEVDLVRFSEDSFSRVHYGMYQSMCMPQISSCPPGSSFMSRS